MSSYYIPLPAPEMPRNALLDFSPIRQAAQDWRQADQDEYERKQKEKELLYQRGQNALANSRAERSLALQELNARKKDIRTVNEGDTIVETDPITGKTTSVFSSGYTPSVSESIFFNRSSMPKNDNLMPEISNPTFGEMSQININKSSLLPQQKTAQEISDAGPSSIFNSPIMETNSIVQNAEKNSVSKNIDDNLIKTPFGNITKEQFAQIAQSKKPFDQALVKHVMENQKNPDAGVYKDVKQKTDVEESLRKEFAQQAKPFFEVRDAFNRIKASSQIPSAAGDLALVFNYMKILDPGSTVREGEFANAQNAAGVPERIRNLFNNVSTGQRLAPEQRNDFLSTAERLKIAQERQYQKVQNQYKNIAKRSGLNVDNVILDYSIPEDDQIIQSQPLPQNGIVDNGNYDWTPEKGIRK